MGKVRISRNLQKILSDSDARTQLSSLLEQPTGVARNITVGNEIIKVVIGRSQVSSVRTNDSEQIDPNKLPIAHLCSRDGAVKPYPILHCSYCLHGGEDYTLRQLVEKINQRQD